MARCYPVTVSSAVVRWIAGDGAPKSISKGYGVLGTRFSPFAAYGRRLSGRTNSTYAATFAAALFLSAVALPVSSALGQETVVIGSGGSGVEVNLDVLDSLGRPPGIFGRRPPLYGERNVVVPRLRLPAEAKVSAPHSSAPATANGVGALPAPTSVPPGITPLPRPNAMTATSPAQARTVQPLQPAQPGTRTAAVPPPASPSPVTSATVPQQSTQPVQKPQDTAPAPKISAPSPAPAAPPAPRPAPQAPVMAAPVPQAPAPQTPVPQAQAPEPPRIVSNKPAPAVSGGKVIVSFKPGFSELDGPARRVLAALAQELVRSNDRVQLKAYAGVNDGTPAEARRLSLSRALAVRSFLIEEGVRATRIDVRALGAPKDGSDPERVEVIRLGG